MTLDAGAKILDCPVLNMCNMCLYPALAPADASFLYIPVSVVLSVMPTRGVIHLTI